jgi:hypothetical protein
VISVTNLFWSVNISPHCKHRLEGPDKVGRVPAFATRRQFHICGTCMLFHGRFHGMRQDDSSWGAGHRGIMPKPIPRDRSLSVRRCWLSQARLQQTKGRMQGIDGVLVNLGIPYSYGFAIIVLTLAVKIATFPLTQKQVASTLAMQAIQPSMNVLKSKYPNDPERLQLETARLYKQANVNPLAGTSQSYA